MRVQCTPTTALHPSFAVPVGCGPWLASFSCRQGVCMVLAASEAAADPCRLM